jgi:hypothetical protein
MCRLARDAASSRHSAGSARHHRPRSLGATVLPLGAGALRLWGLLFTLVQFLEFAQINTPTVKKCPIGLVLVQGFIVVLD